MRLFLSILLCTTSLAWEIDQRCPPEFGERGRRLQDPTPSSDHPTSTVTSIKAQNLRGTTELTRDLLLSTFQLKMYWQEGWCWQQEWIERKWCMSCQGSKCTKGEHLWLQFCNADDSTQKFMYMPVDGSGGGQFKTESANLCLERVTDALLLLEDCKGSNMEKQIFTGFQSDGSRMELHPKGEDKKCLVNREHYPKVGELIYASSCTNAQNVHTNEWIIYTGGSTSNPDTANERSSLRLRNNTQCTSSRRCDRCQGDCDSDDDCIGNLKCFLRGGMEEVPGCFGIGPIGRDYCYETSDPTIVHGTAFNSTTLKLRSPECSSSQPCDICEGDCDSDDQCKDDLKCFMRNGESNQGVPGCFGSGTGTKDYCYQPTTIKNVIPTNSISTVLKLRYPECSDSEPCDVCEGDCDNDEHCKDGLKCFMRTGDSNQNVPGCVGSLTGTKDYCYNPNNGSSNMTIVGENDIIGIPLNAPGCSEDRPCGLCQGDCDTDDDCAGALVCMRKDGPGSVVGCLGYDTSKTDFCVNP